MMIQIDKFFFEPTSFTPNPKEKGKTRMSRNGTTHVQNNYEYMEFDITLENVSPSMHSNLLYIKDLNREYNGSSAQNFKLVDDLGNQYTVMIPTEDYDYDRENGKEVTYTWDLTLREVI